MKKLISFLMLIVLGLSILSGCASLGNVKADIKSDPTIKKISVVATIFPQYDFVHQITGDNVDLTMLLSPGAESHSYEPTPQDIMKVQNCDVFIYVGGDSDAWVDKLLSSVDRSKMKILRLVDCVDTVDEETVAGMEADKDESESGEPEQDEHVWTSPKNAVKIVNKISEVISEADAANKVQYQLNTVSYVKKLNALDKEFQNVAANAARKTIVVGDRFPFRYFVDDYGLAYYAAFHGCADEAEASASTIAFLIGKVKTEHIPVVFHIELSNEKMADTICEATGAKKLLLHACHNISKKDFDDGETYLSLMEQNVQNLKEALQ